MITKIITETLWKLLSQECKKNYESVHCSLMNSETTSDEPKKGEHRPCLCQRAGFDPNTDSKQR